MCFQVFLPATLYFYSKYTCITAYTQITKHDDCYLQRREEKQGELGRTFQAAPRTVYIIRVPGDQKWMFSKEEERMGTPGGGTARAMAAKCETTWHSQRVALIQSLGVHVLQSVLASVFIHLTNAS